MFQQQYIQSFNFFVAKAPFLCWCGAPPDFFSAIQVWPHTFVDLASQEHFRSISRSLSRPYQKKQWTESVLHSKKHLQNRCNGLGFVLVQNHRLLVNTSTFVLFQVWSEAYSIVTIRSKMIGTQFFPFYIAEK